MTSKENSLILYEPRNTWMNNLLCKLGVMSVKEEVKEEKKEPESKKTVNHNENQPNNNGSSDNKRAFDSDDLCDKYLKTLDPKHWKDQDHYKVLGLSKLRYMATESEIKKSYRKIVLRHHPDKRGQHDVNLDIDYYSCITKAYELLSDPVKRRSYDSIDNSFDNNVPNVTTYNKNHFFEVFPIFFDWNARWSNKKPVPLLGNANSTFDEVNEFYNFWYDFDSWREYSYLDEEEKEKGENREERRYLDKQNKAARQQRKKEEMQRIRQLVDNAYQCDPRVAKFKENEKKRKAELKQAKQASIKAKKDEEERLRKEKEEQELAAKKKLEDEEKQRKEKERKQKEATKKKIRQEIKQLETIFKNCNYFTNDDSVKIQRMQELDQLCRIKKLEELVLFREKLQELSTENEKQLFFVSQVEQLNKILETERIKTAKTSTSNTSNNSNNTNSKKTWSYDDIQLLIKAVKLFPAGTTNRWTVIANYINDKTDSGVIRNHRDVLEKTKELQHTGESQVLKEEANKNAFKKLETQTVNPPPVTAKAPESIPSERYDAPSTILDVNDTPWTNDEQQLLEQAMKTYPANLGVERWNLIADCIPNRSRADCIKRFKYLVDMVKSKNMGKTTKK